MAKEQDDILNEVTEGEYKYGFVSDVETEMIKWIGDPLDFTKERRAGMAPGIPFEGLPALAYDENAHVGEIGDPTYWLSGYRVLCGPETRGEKIVGWGRSRIESDIW